MSDCFCDLEMPTAQRVKERKARREHRCTECRGTIKPGEHYRIITTLAEGHWMTDKQCPDCIFTIAEVGRELFAECGGWCYPLGEMRSELAMEARESPAGARIGHMFNAAMRERGGLPVEVPHG